MNEINNWIPALSGEWSWIAQVFLVVLATAFVSFFVKRLLAKLFQRTGKTQTRWDDIIVEAMRRPITWVVWLEGLDISIDIVYDRTQNVLFSYSDPVRDVGILLCLTWFLLGLVRGAEQEFGRDADQVDKHTVEAIAKLVRLAVIITAALVILQTLGFSISGVLAMGGIGGIAVGFAAKDLLANWDNRIEVLETQRASQKSDYQEIVQAKAERLKAKSDLLNKLIQLEIEHAKLRGTMGLLAPECGYTSSHGVCPCQ